VIYGFVEAQKANHPLSTMCRTLKVSKSGYYGWRERPPSERSKADGVLLREQIERIHQQSRRGTYGAPRIHSELRTLGIRCARKRVAKLMRETGLFGCGGRRRARTTTHRATAKEDLHKVPDLVKRDFTPVAPDRLWVADITYIRSWEGWLYLSFSCWTPSPEGSSAGRWPTT
jgi:putative transposase